MAAIKLSLALVILQIYTCVALFPTRLVYETPNPTWFENIAIRRDGSILATTVTGPTLYLVQPHSPKQSPKIIQGFEYNTGLLGITELTPDVFVVAGSNFSLEAFAPAPDSSYLYIVTFPRRKGKDPTVTVAAHLPKVALPDGIVTLNDHTVLVADPPNGAIWSVDIKTGAYKIVSSDPLLKGSGVDGLRLHGNKLYFTDTSERLLGRFTIDRKTGIPTGPATVVARYFDSNPLIAAYDDFALSRDGKFAYPVVAGGNTVTQVNVKTGEEVTIAGNLNSTAIAQPTSAAFGRNGDEGTLYVTTAGGLGIPVNGKEIVGGQIVAVKVGRKH